VPLTPGGCPLFDAKPKEAGGQELILASAMHSSHFDTVLGRIGFDEKGDVTGFEPWQWYVWQDGDYEPAVGLSD
jgi:branched-chain amino acid transport system substrate-binding protein